MRIPFRQVARCFSSADESFIILNPVEAGLVRNRRRKPSKLTKRKILPDRPTTYLDFLPEAQKLEEPVVLGIHLQRPETTNITQQRYDLLSKELIKGFKKAQLEEYLITQRVNPTLARKMTKKKMVEYILSKVWQTTISESGSPNEVENVIDLSEEEFVLVLGNNGRLLREWSKSGARISILPARFQILVYSSPETFEWINASLGLFLETLTCLEIDFSNVSDGLHAYLDEAAAKGNLLAVMQRLTNTFFRSHTDGLTVYSAGDASAKNVGLVRRLLLQISQRFVDAHWRPTHYYFDTNEKNVESYGFRPFNDSDALEWIDRAQPWWRWEALKRRDSVELGSVRLRALKKPDFEAAPDALESCEGSLTEQVEKVIADLVDGSKRDSSLNGEPISTTLTVTPGFVLHSQASKVPHSGTSKAFTSNIPYIANLASSLPKFERDVRESTDDLVDRVLDNIVDQPAQEIPENSNEKDENADQWAKLLNLDSELDSEGRQVFATRRKELDLTENIQLVQMRFVVDPQMENADQYPPLEAWVELPSHKDENNAVLTEAPQLMAVPLEATSYVSLPQQHADLKVTYTRTYPVARTESVENFFLGTCRFGRIGLRSAGSWLDVEFEQGKKIRYRYHSAAYVTLADLAFKGEMMQFLQSEGGKIGGRKTEASLVTHRPDNLAEIDVKTAASKALELVNSLNDETQRRQSL